MVPRTRWEANLCEFRDSLDIGITRIRELEAENLELRKEQEKMIVAYKGRTLLEQHLTDIVMRLRLSITCLEATCDESHLNALHDELVRAELDACSCLKLMSSGRERLAFADTEVGT